MEMTTLPRARVASAVARASAGGPWGRRFVGLLLTLLGLAVPAAGWEIRLALENDFLARRSVRDDLYSFAVEVAAEGGPWRLAFTENGFTDREVGLRFDETYLWAGRSFRLGSSLEGSFDVGALRIGEGLFGESAQNAIHELTGDETLELNYLSSSRVFPAARLALGRAFRAGSRLELEPRLEAAYAEDVKSHLLLGLRGRARLHRNLVGTFFAGFRRSWASFGPLEFWLEGEAPAADVGLVFRERLSVTWSRNRYGAERHHLRIAYRIALKKREPSPGDSARRSGKDSS